MRLLNSLIYTGATEDSLMTQARATAQCARRAPCVPYGTKNVGTVSDLVGKGIQMIFLLALVHLNPHKRRLCMGAG